MVPNGTTFWGSVGVAVVAGLGAVRKFLKNGRDLSRLRREVEEIKDDRADMNARVSVLETQHEEIQRRLGSIERSQRDMHRENTRKLEGLDDKLTALLRRPSP